MPGLLTGLSQSLQTKLSERRAPCALLELDDEDKPVGDFIQFQYFPETISDTKAVNYRTQEIPGGSLPLYQWISSGERVISFNAVFTSDVDLGADPSLASNLATKGLSRRNFDLRLMFIWLRRFMLPRYERAAARVGGALTKAPRKLVLFIPNSGIGLAGGAVDYGSDLTNSNISPATMQEFQDGGASAAADVLSNSFSNKANSIDNERIASASIGDSRLPVIMTQCDATYEAWFPSGLPRIMTVSLSFAQTAQLGGAVNFPKDTDDLQGRTYKPLPFKVKIS